MREDNRRMIGEILQLAKLCVVMAFPAMILLVVAASWTTEPVQKGTGCEGQSPRVDPRLTLAKYKGLLEKGIPHEGSIRKIEILEVAEQHWESTNWAPKILPVIYILLVPPPGYERSMYPPDGNIPSCLDGLRVIVGYE